MTRNTGRGKKRQSNPSYDLLVRLMSQTVSSEEISFVFTHWGKVRDVHRPYDDRDYQFVRYEKKDEMKAALRGFQDGSLRYLQPEWIQCSVSESPSNSLFEVVVRDVPANISEKEWHDCFLKYGAVRAVHRIPEINQGVCDMLVAMEDQRSHNIIQALIASLAKYHATLSDIFYGKFIPPASFCAVTETPRPTTSTVSAKTDLRDYLSSPAIVLPSIMLVNSVQAALCRKLSDERSASYYPGKTLEAALGSSAPDPSSFRTVTLLTRKASKSPVGNSSGACDDSSKEATAEVDDLRKDPSDIWFSCGTEVPDFVEAMDETSMPQLQPDCTFLKDPKSFPIAVTAPAPSVREAKETSTSVSGEDESSSSPDGVRLTTVEDIGSSLVLSSHCPHEDGDVMDKIELKEGHDNKERFGELRRDRSQPSSPRTLKVNPLKTASPLFPTSKISREAWKARNRLRRHGSDPVSLKQFAAMHQSSLSELPIYINKSRKRAPSSSNEQQLLMADAQGVKSKTSIEQWATIANNGPVSLMGVPFPCDQSPLRAHYTAAKIEGRVVTLRFSEIKLEITSGFPVLQDDIALSLQEQVAEDCLIIKWQRAYELFQMRKKMRVNERPDERTMSPSEQAVRKACAELAADKKNLELNGNDRDHSFGVSSLQPGRKRLEGVF